jgi:hypothetical protein
MKTSRGPSYLAYHIDVDLVARRCSHRIVVVGAIRTSQMHSLNRRHPSLLVSIDNSELEEAAGSYTHLAVEAVRMLEVCQDGQRRLSGWKSQRFLRVVARLGLVLLWWPSVSSMIP